MTGDAEGALLDVTTVGDAEGIPIGLMEFVLLFDSLTDADIVSVPA